MKKIAIVGAGVAGMTAAVRLQHEGFDVTVYEKRATIGGKMSQIKGNGFTFDLGPTIVMMPDIYRQVFKDTGVNPDDYIRFELLDPMYRVTFSDGDTIDAQATTAGMIAELERHGEEATSGYLKYLSETYDKYLVAKTHFIEKSFRKPRDFYNLKTLRQAMKLKTFDSAHHTIEKYVKNDKIQKLLAFQTLYIGISPKKGPSIYTIIPMIETLYGVHYCQGGMYTYMNALQKRFEELGGTIKVNTEVEHLLFVDNVTTGVEVNGLPVPYDSVIVNADFPYAMNTLIADNRAKGKYTEEKLAAMDYSCGVVLLYIGLKKKVPDLKVHNLYFGMDFDQNLEEIFTGVLPEDPAFYIYAPSRIDPSVAPEGKEGLYVLVPVPELKSSTFVWNDILKKDYKEKLLTILAKIPGLEDINEQIEFLDMMTPDRFEKELSAQYGAAFGLAPTLLQSNYFRPKIVYPYAKKLYFTGSSVHPGAGVPIAITSGKLAYQEVTKDLNKRKM